ncbi:ribokinase [uncultured Sphaerochaeta sp.]|uniref:ribokinase n=1 Tax=uncultured Sphaerochaeta sp. TaxID=886478 RepID=UPI002A0A3DB8|nr:ribokinase [uncultured Sphaerochaeta sp.]
MKFLNYGSINIDLVFSVDHMVKPGETISSTGLEKSAGGKGANQSAALAKAGATVFHGGKIGSDGRFLVDLLKDYGVDTSFVREYEGATGQALIQLDKNRQNAIVLFGGGNHQIMQSEIDETLMHFEEGDMLVLQNEIVNGSYLITQAKAKGMKVCLNTAPFDENLRHLPLSKVDILVMNEIEGASLAGIETEKSFKVILEKLVEDYPDSEIVLTVGKAGVYYGYREVRLHEPIYDIPVVDTTAAGDTFIGYFLASRAKGYSTQETLAYSCKASGLAVSKNGAMASIPFASEVFC